jgi:hypothetical protein
MSRISRRQFVKRAVITSAAMAAFCTSDPGEPVTQNPAVQVAVNDGPKIGTIKPIGPFKPFFIDPFKVLEMIFHTLVIGGILRSAGTINCGLLGDFRKNSVSLSTFGSF